MEAIAESAQPTWKPDEPLPDDPRNFWTLSYGLTTFGDLFTPRQLVALTTFSDLVGRSPRTHPRRRPESRHGRRRHGLDAGGTGATAYAEAVAYLAFAVIRLRTTGPAFALGTQARSACAIRLVARRFRWFGTMRKPMLSRNRRECFQCFDWAKKALRTFPERRISLARQLDAQNQEIYEWKVFRPIHLITTISAMRIFQIFSTSGCAASRSVYPDPFCDSRSAESRGACGHAVSAWRERRCGEVLSWTA